MKAKSKEETSNKEAVKDDSEKAVYIDGSDIGSASPNDADKTRTNKDEQVNAVEHFALNKEKDATGSDLKFVREGNNDSIVSNEVNEKVKHLEDIVKELEKKLSAVGTASTKDTSPDAANVFAKVKDMPEPRISRNIASAESGKVKGADTSTYMEKYEKYLKRAAEV